MASASRGLAPREGLGLLSLKLDRTGPSTEPHHGPQAGKSGYPHSQDADSSPRAQGALELGIKAKPKAKCGAPRALTACGLIRPFCIMLLYRYSLHYGLLLHIMSQYLCLFSLILQGLHEEGECR